MMLTRPVILATIAGLILLLATLATNLQRELRMLSTAASDNLQWSFLQVETEIALLAAAIAEERASRAPDDARIRLRTDIALSRIGLISQGQAFAVIAGNERAVGHLRQLETFAGQAASLIDSVETISKSELGALAPLTAAAMRNARMLAVAGLTEIARAGDSARDDFAQTLRRSGLLAVGLIVGLLLLLFVLDRLLVRARRADAELRATTERASATVAAAYDGIILADHRWKILEMNEAATQIFGWTVAETRGKCLGETLIARTDGNPDWSAISAEPASAGDVPRRMELCGQTKTGKTFPLELSIARTSHPQGDIHIAYMRDISAEKRAQQALIDARDQARRTDQAKSQFLAVMSHEMRTPLNGILGVLDLLETTDLDAQQRRYVDVAAASGQILLEHTDEALDIARIEAGAFTLEDASYSIPEALERVVSVLRALAAEKGLTLTLDVKPEVASMACGDSGRLTQIVTNLVGNGIKFTQSGGISVVASGTPQDSPDRFTISVNDTGPGIPSTHLDTIFENFVALDPGKGRQIRGDGLGLAISRKLAQLMGGDIDVTSEVGAGSTFTLTLPFIPSAQPEARSTHPPSSAMPAAEEDQKSILIMEDNAINSMVLTEMLQRLGHRVRTATDGAEGLLIAQDEAFDTLIIDISMPKLTGIEVTERIRAGDGPNQASYIVGLTAFGSNEFRDAALAAGMDAFASKPIRIKELGPILDRQPVPTATGPGASAAIDGEILGELAATLGHDKTVETCERFFTEVNAMGTAAPSGPAQWQELGAELHKLRGSASMLGLTQHIALIDRAARAADDTDPAALEAVFDALPKLRAKIAPMLRSV
ncbi:sensory box histidine kinase/response regulator [Candidatus Rhodobacter oscarellae]|uniref:histidine kinase n=1 Tax=Candidatus Rhodobacter oscarellae TaxID=1675527 RepID=A0A0J9EA16_9RHOB|nr:ATP-binding protein [Candidatus Rhodobacter lobularis]KMW59615.1 sensory box histidine kinase/response regulator [Candidatus Rhodobacter lobularis]